MTGFAGRRGSSDALDGLRDVFPVVVVAIPIGLLFGTLCRVKDISTVEAGLMSLLVNAGGVQFAAVELWADPIPPLAAILFSTLLINIRHALIGMSIAPGMAAGGITRRGLMGAFAFLTDPTWGAAAGRIRSGHPITWPYWLAVAIPFTASWVGSSVAGAWLGAYLGDPRAFGADFALAALFLAMSMKLWSGWRTTGVVIAASGCFSALAWVVAGSPWHVMAGAFAGIAAAWVIGPVAAEAPAAADREA